MHLNADETWNVGASIDLFSVALHEAGHALGLAHTDDPTAVMYPYYRFNTAGLSANDIGGVQALYGAQQTAPTPPVVPTPPVTPTPPVPTPQPPVPTPPVPTPATLSITIASPNTTFSTTGTTVSVSGTASGSGTLRVNWADDRGGSGTASGAANWTITSLTLATGANNITATVTDGAGRTAAKTISITRTTPSSQPTDTTPPTLQILSPSSAMISTSASVISLSGTASDNVGVAAVRWTNSFGAGGDAIGTTNWQIANIPLLVGTNKITVRAFDAAGNSRWQLVSVVRH
jgi:hypothetical protein